jgi:hypothetical protein
MKWLFIALGMTVILSGCSTSIAGEKQPGRTFEIVQTNFLGSLWNESHARASIVSQDGGQSFAVPRGAIWAFGDTFKGSRSADGAPHFAGGAVSCSIAFLEENARIYPPTFNYLVSSNGDVVSPFAYLKKYVMTSSSDFDHPREIRFLLADAPYGPWSPSVARIEVPEYRQGKRVELVYCAYLHPELFRENGRVMNLTCSLGLKDAGFDNNCEMVEIGLKLREAQKP